MSILGGIAGTKKPKPKPKPKKKVERKEEIETPATEAQEIEQSDPESQAKEKPVKKRGRKAGQTKPEKYSKGSRVRVPKEVRDQFAAMDKIALFDTLYNGNKFLRGMASDREDPSRVKRIVVEFHDEAFNAIKDELESKNIKTSDFIREYLIKECVPDKVKEEWVIQCLAGLRQ